MFIILKMQDSLNESSISERKIENWLKEAFRGSEDLVGDGVENLKLEPAKKGELGDRSDFTKFSEPEYDPGENILIYDPRELEERNEKDLEERVKEGWIREIYDGAIQRISEEIREQMSGSNDKGPVIEDLRFEREKNGSNASIAWQKGSKIGVGESLRPEINPFTLSTSDCLEQILRHEISHVIHQEETELKQEFDIWVAGKTLNSDEYFSHIDIAWLEAIAKFEEDPAGNHFERNKRIRRDLNSHLEYLVIESHMEPEGEHLFSDPYELADLYQNLVFLSKQRESEEPYKETRRDLKLKPRSAKEMEEAISKMLIQLEIPDYLSKFREFREKLEEEESFHGRFAEAILDSEIYDTSDRELFYDLMAFSYAVKEAREKDFTCRESYTQS